MTDRMTDNYLREEQDGAQEAPRRRGTLRRLLTALLVLVLVLGLVAFVAYRDLNSIDSLRRLLTYNKTTQDDSGRAELYNFDGDRTNVFAMLGDSLLVVSTTRMELLDSKGESVFARSLKLTNPAVAVGGQQAAVYDIGGTALYLVSAKGAVRDESAKSGAGMISASLNGSDYLAVTTQKSGYKSAVTVYDASLEPLFTFNSSDHYVIDACVLDDCKHLAAVTLGEAEGAFASRLSVYALDSEKPVTESALTGSLVLSLQNMGQTLAALQDDRLTTFRADGSLAGSWRYEYPYLRASSLNGDDFCVLLLSRYRSGSALRLVTVDAEGGMLGEQDIRREVLDVSAAGKYVAVLYGDSLEICSADLTQYAVLEGTNYAKHVVMRADGTALLIGSAAAWLFIP